jgi:lipopolysaccharide/colanic/teichoic acid biosynthesis glycosyltransferase/acetyltransferase-like isoleucine patch superfamily enzyme
MATPEPQVGPGLEADPGVLLDYPTQRAVSRLSHVGRDARLRSGTVIYRGSRIGDRLDTGHHVVIHEECLIGDDVSVWSNSVIDHGCTIGDRVKIHTGCYVAQLSDIGEDAFLAPGVVFANDAYAGREGSRDVMSGPTVGAGARLGVNVTVLPSVVIGAGCLIGAGSVVTRDIPAGAVAYGNPAVVHGRVADLTDVAGTASASPLPGPGILARAVDLVLASLLLVVLSPLLLAAYLAVRLDSPGAGIFRQERVGLGGRTFTMLKFRTMRSGCSHESHRDYVTRLMVGQAEPVDGLYKLDCDPRVTRVGALLRRASIDELPQLVNVLRGTMSLVGPRPALPWEVELFPAWARTRFSVRPGITGLWQVSGRSRLTMTEGLRLDVEYVEHRGFWIDIRILLRTPLALVTRSAR